MDWKQVEVKWNQLRDTVRDKWDLLTDEDIDEIGGKYTRLVGKLQEKYGITKHEAETEAEELQLLIDV